MDRTTVAGATLVGIGIVGAGIVVGYGPSSAAQDQTQCYADAIDRYVDVSDPRWVSEVPRVEAHHGMVADFGNRIAFSRPSSSVDATEVFFVTHPKLVEMLRTEGIVDQGVLPRSLTEQKMPGFIAFENGSAYAVTPDGQTAFKVQNATAPKNRRSASPFDLEFGQNCL